MVFKEHEPFKYYQFGKLASAGFVSTVIATIAYYLFLTVSPIVRTGFGQRSYEQTDILTSGLLLFVLIYFSGSSLASLHLLLFIGFVIFHTLVAKRRAAKGDTWYSRSLGRSYLYYTPLVDKFHPSYIDRYIEPVLFIILGGFVSSTVSYEYGAFLVACGFSIAIIGNYFYNQYWNSILDQIDGRLLSDFYTEEIEAAIAKKGGDTSVKIKTNEKGIKSYGLSASNEAINFYAEKQKAQIKEGKGEDEFI